jgi:hypothetical protein
MAALLREGKLLHPGRKFTISESDFFGFVKPVETMRFNRLSTRMIFLR